MRRLKRSTAFLQRSRDCLRGNRASPARLDFARIKSGGGSVVPTGGLVCGRNAGATPAATVPIPPGYASRLVNAENVRVACSDLTLVNVACRDICVMPTARRPLPLLSCDRTEAQECEHYSDSHCHDRFGREFHCDYVLCSDAFRRNSFHPPPELKEAML